MKKFAIIVAGGKGLRMGGDLPKQFMLLEGKPVLMWTIETFYRYDNRMKIIVVLPEEQQQYWAALCKEYHFSIPLLVTGGGETRFHSVRNGLQLVGEEGLVAVHDGVRPLVSQKVIHSCFTKAAETGAAIPLLSVWDTLRYVAEGENRTVNRDHYKLVQTPQVFQTGLLQEAYRQEYSPRFTDDASVVEAAGHRIAAVEGNRENIKLTTPFDIKLAKVLIQECRN